MNLLHISSTCTPQKWYLYCCQDRKPLLKDPPKDLDKVAQDTFADLVKEDGNDNEDILKAKPNEKIFGLIIASLNQIKNVVLAYQYVCVGTNDRHKRF